MGQWYAPEGCVLCSSYFFLTWTNSITIKYLRVENSRINKSVNWVNGTDLSDVIYEMVIEREINSLEQYSSITAKGVWSLCTETINISQTQFRLA